MPLVPAVVRQGLQEMPQEHSGLPMGLLRGLLQMPQRREEEALAGQVVVGVPLGVLVGAHPQQGVPLGVGRAGVGKPQVVAEPSAAHLLVDPAQQTLRSQHSNDSLILGRKRCGGGGGGGGGGGAQGGLGNVLDGVPAIGCRAPVDGRHDLLIIHWPNSGVPPGPAVLICP